MRLIKHCLLMWIPFIVIAGSAAALLEMIEGLKITTTEYYGLMNMGPMYILLLFFIAIIYYPLIGAPVSILLYISRIKPVAAIPVCGLLGAIGGFYVFKNSYDAYGDGYFVRGYDLHISTAIIIFAIAGCCYAIVDYWIKKLLLLRGNKQ